MEIEGYIVYRPESGVWLYSLLELSVALGCECATLGLRRCSIFSLVVDREQTRALDASRLLNRLAISLQLSFFYKLICGAQNLYTY